MPITDRDRRKVEVSNTLGIVCQYLVKSDPMKAEVAAGRYWGVMESTPFAVTEMTKVLPAIP